MILVALVTLLLSILNTKWRHICPRVLWVNTLRHEQLGNKDRGEKRRWKPKGTIKKNEAWTKCRAGVMWPCLKTRVCRRIHQTVQYRPLLLLFQMKSNYGWHLRNYWYLHTDHIHVVRDELATTKNEMQTSISALEATTASLENTIKELGKLHTLQCQVTRLNSNVEKRTEKCEDLEGHSRRHNIRIIGIPEGIEGPRPLGFICESTARCTLMRSLLLTEHWTLLKRSEPHELPGPSEVTLLPYAGGYTAAKPQEWSEVAK